MKKKFERDKVWSVPEVLAKIDAAYSVYNSEEHSGFPALIYTDAKLKQAFAKAVDKHGTNGSCIHRDIVGAGFGITSKTVHVYLRRFFGSYNRRGRPAKYLK